MNLSLEQVVHFKLPSPDNNIFGWSLIKAAAYAHETQSFMNIYHRNFFQNSARPDYVLTTDQPIHEDQARMILEQWKSEFGGVHRAHLPAILGMGLEPKALQLTNTDVQFLGVAEWTLDQLIAVYGVPKAKLGLVADSNRSNADAADITFQRETIRPEMLRITEAIQLGVLSLYPSPDNVVLDLGFPDPVPQDREFELEKREREFRSGIRTLNEARSAADLEPFPPELGDRIKLQMQDILIPTGSSAQIIDAVTGILMPPGGGEGGGQPVGVEEGENDDGSQKLLPPADVRGTDVMFSTDARLAHWWYTWVIRTLRGEDALDKWFRSQFRSQQRAVLAAIEEVIPDTGRAENEPTIEQVIRLALGSEVDDLMAEELAKQLAILSAREGQFLLDALGIDLEMSPINPDILSFLESKPIRVKGVNDVTREFIRGTLREWQIHGEGVVELQKRISTVFDTTLGRARRIARTEAIGALNAGSEAAIREAEIPYKQWLSSRDGKVRDTHLAADTQIVRVDEPFRVGAAQLMYPGDPNSGYAEEIVNCRCTLIPKTRRD